MTFRESDIDPAEPALDQLRTIAQTLDLSDLSSLTIAEMTSVVRLLEKIAPVNDVAGLISSGYARLPESPSPAESSSRRSTLRSGWHTLRDKALFGTFFAGPAAMLWGYQTLLKLAGKSERDAFPEGAWQFYANYALREDTARHAVETDGFDTLLYKHRIFLDPVDRITAWLMAAIHTLHQYHELLRNEWRERVYLHLLAEVSAGEAEQVRLRRMYREWERQRPFRRGADVQVGHDYPTYRRLKFDAFLEKQMWDLPLHQQQAWLSAVQIAKQESLLPFQQQMSILAHLEATPYEEKRVSIPLHKAHVGLIYHGTYYLIPVCQGPHQQPPDLAQVRGAVAAVLNGTQAQLRWDGLTEWTQVRRLAIPELRRRMAPELMQELDLLRQTPILFNADPEPSGTTLAEIRQAERGLGDHPLTLFDTGQSTVFDLSHVFFDGIWGASLAEIMTNEATAWGVYLNTLPPIYPTVGLPRRLDIRFSPEEKEQLATAPQVQVAVAAESSEINLGALLGLRRVFKLRNDLIHLTVNDLLILYRSLHAQRYVPRRELWERLEEMAASSDTAVAEAGQSALRVVHPENGVNPALLIPVDASQKAPFERIHPLNIQVPVEELKLWQLHATAVEAHRAYKRSLGDLRENAYAHFDAAQKAYLSTLAGCGELFQKLKEMAASGQTPEASTLKLLGHLPTPLQRLLDRIPDNFGMINDILKGREVFSNIGAVSSQSSLRRFMTAKDDNKNKALAWGIMSDAQGKMILTLRDFRPHVQQLLALGEAELARDITRDYLESYVLGLNQYVNELRRVTMASRETRSVSDIGKLDVQNDHE